MLITATSSVRLLSNEALASLARPYLESAFGRWHAWQPGETGADSPDAWLGTLLDGLGEQLATMADLAEAARFLLDSVCITPSPEMAEFLAQPHAPAVLAAFAEMLQGLPSLDTDTINVGLRSLRHQSKAELGLRGQAVMQPIRAALTGQVAGPCLAVAVSLLGTRRCLERVAPYLTDRPEGLPKSPPLCTD